MADNHRILAFAPVQACAVEDTGDVPELLRGASAAMTRLWAQIRCVAPHFRCALLIGEAGTGAEAVARALHQRSRFRASPLVILSAPEAELYFSNSARWNELAQRMVFLPEIERMSRIAQRGLLGLMRLRGARAAATVAFAGHDLRPLVSAGVFSQELAASLAAVRLCLPPLRERGDDLHALMDRILAQLCVKTGRVLPVVSEDFATAAAAHTWPGNLDELEATLALAVQDGADELHTDDFNAALEQRRSTKVEIPGQVRMVRLDQVVEEHIRAVLFACHGNKLRAAEVLGISRSTLYRMLDAAGNSMLRLAS